MPSKEYQEVTNWLFNQFPSYQKIGSDAYKPTLENILKITSLIDSPQNQLKFVHIAGSNGKGSVSSIVSSSLTEAGYKVGLFTSPHILDFSERIRINGVPIGENEVIKFVNKIRKHSFDFEPSFFEVTFALALSHFNTNDCDICIIETGLGGRLDATNIITPLISAITTISLEHTDILGNSLEEITIEKAGIIKENSDVVIGQLSPNLIELIQNRCDILNTSIHLSSSTVIPANIESQFIAPFQNDNLRTAICTLNLLADKGFTFTSTHIQKGLNNLQKNAGYYGRLQLMKTSPNIIFDVSHNAAGIKVSIAAIKAKFKGHLHIVFGSSSDKDLELIKKVFSPNNSYYFTEFSHLRSAKINQLQDTFSSINLDSVNYYKDAHLAYEEAIKNSSKNDTVLVIGSFFLLQEFY